ncbi:MAG: hypothetical protein NW224_01270 [Leptolyngbyaceae cyanobacterium bins.302]|nr:hypothetical protein [Leptolyngbyaceae cyanobacterium bins.302]
MDTTSCLIALREKLMNTECYGIIIGSGKAGKASAPVLVVTERKTFSGKEK